MNPEPLTKEKIILSEHDINIDEERYVSESDIKSAVEWLLKEIEKEIKYWERAKEHEKDGSQIAYYNRRISELNWCIEKIKKAFSGVLRE